MKNNGYKLTDTKYMQDLNTFDMHCEQQMAQLQKLSFKDWPLSLDAVRFQQKCQTQHLLQIEW